MLLAVYINIFKKPEDPQEGKSASMMDLTPDCSISLSLEEYGSIEILYFQFQGNLGLPVYYNSDQDVEVYN
jgi:hypothetical protein